VLTVHSSVVHSSLFTFHCFISALSFGAVWTGGRVAEGVGLENRYTREGIVGSNPTLSVNILPVALPSGNLIGATRQVC
jgi:hypothetical protein